MSPILGAIARTTGAVYDVRSERISGMNVDLVITYVVNLAYMLLRAMVYAVGCFLAWRAFDKMSKVDIRREISENGNLGWAIIIASMFIGLAFVVGQL